MSVMNDELCGESGKSMEHAMAAPTPALEEPMIDGYPLWSGLPPPAAREASTQEPVITDHEGRPVQYWGGKAAPSQEPVAWVTVENGVCVSTRSANFSHVPDGQYRLHIGTVQAGEAEPSLLERLERELDRACDQHHEVARKLHQKQDDFDLYVEQAVKIHKEQKEQIAQLQARIKELEAPPQEPVGMVYLKQDGSLGTLCRGDMRMDAFAVYRMPIDAAAQIESLTKRLHECDTARLAVIANRDEIWDEREKYQKQTAKLQARLHEVSLDWQTLHAERDKLQAELNEEARLNGKGAEREAALLGKVERLEAERDNWFDEAKHHCTKSDQQFMQITQLTAAARMAIDYLANDGTDYMTVIAALRDALGEVK